MIRLAISPLLIALGMALTAHFLALAWADWTACFKVLSGQNATPYWDYLTSLLSLRGMAALTLGAPFLPFFLVALFIRAPERLFWQWVGLGITIGVLAIVLSGLIQSCPDEGTPSEYGIPELAPIIIGLVVAFPVCLVVTYIGSVRHARRNALN